ncbi:Rv1733c family protein [Streptomyces olivaceoviridis]
MDRGRAGRGGCGRDGRDGRGPELRGGPLRPPTGRGRPARIENASDAASTHADVRDNADATVRWTTPDGRTRTGRAVVPARTPAGTRVPVRTDSRGDLVSDPPGRSDAMLKFSLVGVGTAMAAGCAVWGSARAARALLDRRGMRQWALEWERAAPRRGGATA